MEKDMFEVLFYDLGYDYDELARVVCVARFKDKWVFCKHKKRDTWELAGGHIEKGETWQEALKREMFEETGTTKLEYKPIALYSISSFGILCYVEIKEIGEIPEEFEIEKIGLFDEIPDNLTYPDTHKKMFEYVVENLKNN
jgi:8-oxo-dGTP diphosphatase